MPSCPAQAERRHHVFTLRAALESVAAAVERAKLASQSPKDYMRAILVWAIESPQIVHALPCHVEVRGVDGLPGC